MMVKVRAKGQEMHYVSMGPHGLISIKVSLCVCVCARMHMRACVCACVAEMVE